MYNQYITSILPSLNCTPSPQSFTFHRASRDAPQLVPAGCAVSTLPSLWTGSRCEGPAVKC